MRGAGRADLLAPSQGKRAAEVGLSEPQVCRWLLVGLGLGLLGAVWALGGAAVCPSCGDTPRLAGGLPLGWIGTVFYATALAGVARWGPAAPVRLAVFGAAGVHLSLIVTLWTSRAFCPSCLVSAAGAFLAMAVAWLRGERLIVAGAVVFLLAAGGTTFAVGRAAAEAQFIALREARRAMDQVLAEPEPAPGTARVVLFTRAGCPACRHLKEQVLAPLVREAAGKIQVEERPAWDGVWSPTMAVRGWERFLFLGVPPVEDLRRALQLGRGKQGPMPQRGLHYPRPKPRSQRRPLASPARNPAAGP